MTHNTSDLLSDARKHLEIARRCEESLQFDAAASSFLDAHNAARTFWTDTTHPKELRAQSARLSADAVYAAGMAHARLSPPKTDTLSQATLVGIEIFELQDLNDDVKLHGLYRAQCSAFELGHQCMDHNPTRAKKLFNDAIQCAEALPTLHNTKEPTRARVLANAAASGLAYAGLERDDPREFKEILTQAIEHGQASLDLDALPPHMHAETLILLGDAAYEIALAEKEQPKALERLQDALGWTREASQAPGSDAVLQNDALLRGARYACVYGLYLRHTDFDGGIEALQGSVDLALTVAHNTHLPPEMRGTAHDTAIRTQQNIALLLKPQHPQRALQAFEHSSELARDAAADPSTPNPFRATFLYLLANSCLERSVLLRALQPSSSETSKLLLEILAHARNITRIDTAPHEIQARSALLACGAAGRLLQGVQPGDEDGIRTHLQTIERFGQIAASSSQATDSIRARGAYFAADAIQNLAKRLTNPAAIAEAQHRADTLMALYRSLEPQTDSTVH